MLKITYEIKASKECYLTTEDLDFIETCREQHPIHLEERQIAELYWESVFTDWDYPTEGTVFVRREGSSIWKQFEIDVQCTPLIVATKRQLV